MLPKFVLNGNNSTDNYCKVVSYASSIRLLPAALGPSFLDKGVGIGPTATQFGPVCV